jgi:hypothetical protein
MRHDRTWQSRRLAPRRQIDLICAPYLTSAAGSVAMQNGGSRVTAADQLQSLSVIGTMAR